MAKPKVGDKPAPPKKPINKPAAKIRAAGSVAPRRVGAPTIYTPELATAICTQIAEGKSLRAIAATEGMPSVTAIMGWLGSGDKPEFVLQYARAHEARAETMGEELLAIADEECTAVKADKHGAQGDADGMVEVVFDATAVARNRLRVDARKWLMSKMAPKKYGDKVQAEHSGPGGAPIAIQSTVTFVDAPVRSEGDE